MELQIIELSQFNSRLARNLNADEIIRYVLKANGSAKNSDGRTMKQIFLDTCRHLQRIDKVKETFVEFGALITNSDRVNFVLKLFAPFEDTIDWKNEGKDDALSEDYRRKGNACYQAKNNAMAILNYNTSIAYAVEGTEQCALGYANRSAVWMEVERYHECLNDISKAFSNNYPENLKPKLLKRKTKAEELQPRQKPSKLHEPLPALKDGRNDLISCASSDVKILSTELYGRQVVAKTDIKVGDVLAVEKPYISVPVEECRMTHCNHCLTPCFDLTPCRQCSSCVFCSDKCRDEAWERYHKYECKFGRTLAALSLSNPANLALRIAILSKNEYKNIHDFETPKKQYESGRYEEIHNLVSNSDKRPPVDLFYRAFETAVLFHIVREKTDFFANDQEEDVFKHVLMHNLQTGPSNFHEISNLTKLSKSSVYAPVEIGSGAYSFLSLLNHECSPNVVRHCYGNAVVLRALRPIKEGEQLFDNYGYHFAVETLPNRRKSLLLQYYFDCKCTSCAEDWPMFDGQPSKQLKDVDERTNDLLEKLQMGDLEVALGEIKTLEQYAQDFDEMFPCEELCRLQECIKQCYAIFGSKHDI